MNPTLELLANHRSIRAFEDAPVPDADLEAAVRSGQAAATSSHIQAYSLIEVIDRQERKTLVELTGGQPWVESCGRFLVVCADIRRHRLVAEAAGVANVQNLETFLLGVIDATLFAQNTVVALESMGYGICYIGGLRNRLSSVVELLEIPDGVWPLYGLCVGVPAQNPETKPRLPIEAVLHRGRYASDGDLREMIEAYDGTMSAYYERREKPGWNWSGALSRRFSHPQRSDLPDVYRQLGARPD